MDMKIKSLINYLNKNIKEDTIFKFIIEFVFNIIFYGLILNIMLSSLFGLVFSFNTIIALGIFYYFIKIELPPIIISCLPLLNKRS
jgi:hypothetical protein